MEPHNHFLQICGMASEWLPSVEGSVSAVTTIALPTTNIQLTGALRPRAQEAGKAFPQPVCQSNFESMTEPSGSPFLSMKLRVGLSASRILYAIVRAVVDAALICPSLQ